MGVRSSMGTVGDAYDNAMAESFFATLECELLERRSWKSKAEARAALFTWIEGWYNPRRLHSALGYLSPITFEEKQDAENDRAMKHGLPTPAVGPSQAPPAGGQPCACRGLRTSEYLSVGSGQDHTVKLIPCLRPQRDCKVNMALLSACRDNTFLPG